jgi:hypothetical protein
MSPSPNLMQRLSAWLPDNPDETVLRWIFRCVVSVTVAVLAADLAGMNASVGNPDSSEVRPESAAPASPALLPPLLAPLPPDKRLVQVPEPKGPLANPMSFELIGGGRLMATGTITPGISQAFAAEIEKRGDYIRTVVLDSPGGSVADALAMGRLIRDRKLATEVEPGKFCASSCPLVFAGGIERRAGDRATIGVHQIAAVSQDRGPPRDEMSLAQKVSARCQRYLGDMGVDLQVWIHAMETPHDKLFVFKPDELKSLSLVTAPLATGGPLPPGVAKSRS